MIHDAIVIGGGPSGSTAALMLARAGWSVAVVEKATFPRRKVCGEFISATSMPLLRELGLAESFFERAGPEVQRVGLFVKDAMVASAMPSGGFGRALGREHLDMLLLDAATRAGAELWQPWQAIRIERCQKTFNCAVVHAGKSCEIKGRIVIAACGSWERGPHPLMHDRLHAPSNLLAFKAHFSGSDLPTDLMPLLAFSGGYGGMVHSDSGRMTLSCCIRRDALARYRMQGPERHAGEAVLAHIINSCLGVRQALRRARVEGAWLSAGPIRPGMHAVYADGIYRLGNLAGEAHPVVAEGISMAMQSAWLLARKLVAEAELRPSAEIARDYQSDWTSKFAGRIRAAHLLAAVAMRPALLMPMVVPLSACPQLLTAFAILSGKVKQVVPAP